MTDTIVALSSGAPPAAIAVLRISGPAARQVASSLVGLVPEPRHATLRRLRDAAGETLDHALVLWFPGPNTATGEDLLELHVHGGRAVVAAVKQAVLGLGVRHAEPGEFTRRALEAGRIDLAQAAGLADLLEAETDGQRRAALAASEGALSRQVRAWLDRLSALRAQVEAAIDYDEEGDVAPGDTAGDLAALHAELRRTAEAPTSERVREGVRVVIAGPPNAGKSSLFNAMLGQDAAIVAPIAGTTRDRIEARVLRAGQLFTLVDTAGLAEATDDVIEQEGIRRSERAIAAADLLLWLGDAPPPRPAAWVRSRVDQRDRAGAGPWDIGVSVLQSETIDALWALVTLRSARLLASSEPYLLQAAQQAAVVAAADDLRLAVATADPLIRAEHLRAAALSLARLTGENATEAMLDALFSRFCVGK